MSELKEKSRTSSCLSRFFSNFWVQLILSVAVLTLIVAVMFDAIAIGIIGHSVWFNYPN